MNTTKKRLIRILLLLILYNFSILGPQSRQDNKISIHYSNIEPNKVERIILLYENLYTLSFARIPCNKLEKTFDLKRKDIQNKDTIQLLINALNRTFKQNKKGNNIDARYKFVIKYNAQPNDTICGDAFSIKFNNQILAIDSTFSGLLEKLTNSKDF